MKKVIQNNFISLGYHLLIGIISFTLFVRLFINKPYTDLLLIMVPMLFYIIAGITFKPAKLIINDLFSFTLVGIIGALLWTYAFLKSPYDLDRHNVLYGAWWPYLFYLGGVTFIDSFMNRNNFIYGNMIAYVCPFAEMNMTFINYPPDGYRFQSIIRAISKYEPANLSKA